MPDNDPVDEAIAELKAAKANIACAKVTRILKSFGFTVIDKKKSGHKVYMHDGIDTFYSSSYSCGHGKNPTVKPVYINQIIRVLANNKLAILKHTGE